MTHIELLERHGAHSAEIELARVYPDLAAMVAASDDILFLRWSLRLIADPRERIGVTAYIVRHTPIGGGLTVYDLLTDARSRHALNVCYRYAIGAATNEELEEARADACAATADASPCAATAVYYTTAAAAAADVSSYAATAAAAAAAVASSYAADAVYYTTAAAVAADAADASSYTTYAAAAADASSYTASADASASAWQSDYIHSLDWATITGEQP